MKEEEHGKLDPCSLCLFELLVDYSNDRHLLGKAKKTAEVRGQAAVGTYSFLESKWQTLESSINLEILACSPKCVYHPGLQNQCYMTHSINKGL